MYRVQGTHVKQANLRTLSDTSGTKFWVFHGIPLNPVYCCIYPCLVPYRGIWYRGDKIRHAELPAVVMSTSFLIFPLKSSETDSACGRTMSLRHYQRLTAAKQECLPHWRPLDVHSRRGNWCKGKSAVFTTKCRGFLQIFPSTKSGK